MPAPQHLTPTAQSVHTAGRGEAHPLGPFRASLCRCSMVGPRKGARSTGWSVELWTGHWGSCLPPRLGGGAGRRKGPHFVPGSVHFSQPLFSLARVDLWVCGIYVCGEGIVLCLHPTSLATVYGMP